eukprot:Gregarina_sp_Poly_1__9575@NODE_604_length_7213_cov_176_066331_g464_i0_p1_GENE_NODE_604_length_7213_cov_176_066331_g464_i0NODE_604_length_7213_cov_176_066331_g464_i0_p1_ORF_typecomplete_len2087_score368_84DEAD/PF00270_29/1_3e20ResIII/PF04851_15/4_6e12Helicase_C/PF00271_31/8_2e03Helicase_C/PF00271_31/6_8e06DUF5087/PF17006_5/0_095AAA_19/PF13245_6/4_8AAA_19/PF13245_6/3_4e02_NODE_604_length_7213_cov_176_066331_g464_i08957155
MDALDDVPADIPEAENEDLAVIDSALPIPRTLVPEAEDDDVSVASEELEINLEDKLNAIPDSLKLSVEQRLAVWYSWLPPVQSDAIEELGGNDSCLVSAEGLILRFASGAEYSHGFLDSPQFLKLIYHVEKFLAELIELGMTNLTLVFFDCFKGLLCKQHPSLWAFREVLRLHCIITNRIAFMQFNDWSQPDYTAYVERRNPFLFIVDDGGNLFPPRSVFACKEEEGNEEEEDEKEKAEDAQEKAAEHGLYGLYSLMLDTVCRGINVSVLYQLEKNGRRVKTYVALPHHAAPKLNFDTLPEVMKIMQEESCLLEAVEASEHLLSFTNWPSLKGKSLPLRLALYRNCGLETGLGPDEDGERDLWAALFYKCLLLHDLVMRCTPLEERPTIVAALEATPYTLTLELLMAHMQSMLTHLLSADRHIEMAQESFRDCLKDVADLFDERVLRSLLFCIVQTHRDDPSTVFDASFFGLPQEWEIILEGVWADMCGACEPLFPLSVVGLEESDFNLLEETPIEVALAVAPPATAPVVLKVTSNDFLTQILDLDAQSLIPGATALEKEADEGQKLVQQFLETETRDLEAAISKTEPGEELISWGRESTFDNANFNVRFNQRKEEKMPKFLLKLSGEEKERAIRKWKQRKLQEKKAYARNINKYFGGLDRLHLPIVLIGGKASAEHPWVLEEKKPEIPGITEKAKEKKTSKKAAEIIAKNQAKIAEKRAAKEEDMGASLYSQMSHLFKKKASKVKIFNEAFLELLVGSRNASDATVLEDFGAIRGVLTLPANRVAFLSDLAEKLMDPLEHTWKRKSIIETNQVADILKAIGLIFRFIQVTVDKHVAVMGAQHIKIFQNLLLMMGFERSSKSTFDFWANQQWKLKRNIHTDNEEVDKSGKKEKKSEKKGKTGANQKSGKNGSKSAPTVSTKSAKDLEALERQKTSYLKKLESDAFVSRSLRKFDFAVNPEQEATFQVKYLGPDMERTLGSCVDPRVSFLPDYWQKRLIDIVDAQESTLVVAPTASGKTFAAYYAMDCVLRFDNESCVIFISPTRALGLQVEAEVIARFSGKTYPSGCKTVLVGNLLEDRSENWNNCQILITVPSCAEMILSSTTPSIREWRSRVRYAIMDEIHCIGDERQGKQWENLIQLLPCPFMALSATVGNEEDFQSWLTKAQSSVSDGKVNFIRHNERYADLQTLYYASGTHSIYNLNPLLCLDFQRLRNGTLTGDFHLIPTDALQTYEQLSRTLSEKLEAADWDAATVKEVKFFITEYAPERFFVHTRSITKKQYRLWLNSILVTIEKLAKREIISENDFVELSKRVAATSPMGVGGPVPWWTEPSIASVTASPAAPLGTPVNMSPISLDAVTGASAEGTQTLGDELGASSHVRSDQFFNDPTEFLRLIRDLEARRLMPALVFNFNRAFASRLLYRVASKLIDDHHNKFYGTPEAAAKTKLINKKRQDEYKAMLATREQAEKWKSLSKEQREEQGIDEQLFAELTGPLPPAPTDIAEDHDPEFFLTDRRTYISSQEEFAEIIRMCRLEWLVKDRKVPQILMESLKRGLGLYHDALNREYRRAVELLFRMRYLRVVVSDVSLSMGVNMPCKTTVFAGDSSLLTPLLFRQTAGRAGRRGFDSLGHVVFWEFPFKKIRRLLCSKLPVLSGGYSVRPTIAVSAMVVSQSNEAHIVDEFLSAHGNVVATLDKPTLKKIDDSRQNYKKIFNEPLYKIGAPDSIKRHLQDNIRVSLRFAVDLARRLGLLQSDGSEDVFSRAALSIPDDEPGNLFLVYSIIKGVLRKLTKKAPSMLTGGGTEEPLDEQIVSLLAFTIKRREYTYSIVRRFELASISPELEVLLLPQIQVADRPTSPLLPPLNPDIEALAVDFDKKVFDNAKQRARAMSLLHPDYYADEGVLPLSDIDFFAPPTASLIETSPLKSWWTRMVLPKECRRPLSAFAALNAVGLDEIASVDELVANLRGLIFIERRMVPQLAIPPVDIRLPKDKEATSLRLLNSYALDILMHKSLRTVIEFNDIPAAEAYFIIQALRESVWRFTGALWEQTSIKEKDASGKAGTSAGAVCSRMQTIAGSLDALYEKIRRFGSN